MFFSIKVRDEYRQDYDAGRGGYGKLAQNQWVVESPIMKAHSFGLLNLTGVTQGLQTCLLFFFFFKPSFDQCFYWAGSLVMVFLLKIIKEQNPKECL